MISKLKGDPTAWAIAVAGFALAAALAFIFAFIVVLPVAALVVLGVYLYRQHQLEKMKSPDKLPETVKSRTDFISPEDFYKVFSRRDPDLIGRVEDDFEEKSCEPLLEAFAAIATQLYIAESFHEPPPRPSTSDRITIGRYHDKLEQWQRKVSDDKNFDVFIQEIIVAWAVLRRFLPTLAFTREPEKNASSPLTTPLIIDQQQGAAQALTGVFWGQELKDRKLFVSLREQVEENIEDEKELTFDKAFVHTAYRALTRVQIPITLQDETRFAGTWIVAPQGMGKTTLLHNLVLDDLKKDAAIILMDSKGDLIEPFMDHPALANRRVIIGPDNMIGMNPLDIPHTDINKAVENLEYLFNVLEFKPTATQSMLFKTIFRSLVTGFEKPTLATFIDMMTKEGPAKYADQIRTLEPDLRQFFATEFFGKNITERRQEVLQRLRLLLDHDLLRSMLMSPVTTFNIGDAMDRGAVIIINNSRGQLGNKGAEFLGRFFIAQVLAAAQQRSSRRQSDKKPVYFYIDECHTVVEKDERITDVLHECRSQKIALTLAHQETSQVSAKVLSAFENCAIRFARPDDETSKLSSSVRMEAKRLRALREGQFAVFIRGLSQQGIVVNVPLPTLSELPRSKLTYKLTPQLPPAAVFEPDPDIFEAEVSAVNATATPPTEEAHPNSTAESKTPDPQPPKDSSDLDSSPQW